jgi:hypothetical protein
VQTVEKALQLFDEHTAGKVAIPADLRLMCYGIAVARRGAPAFVRALARDVCVLVRVCVCGPHTYCARGEGR